jgi:hypothetical protein
MPAAYDVNPFRLALGLLIGAVAAVAYFAIPFAEMWVLVAMVAVPVAAVAAVVVAPVAFVVLRRRQLLSLQAALLIGGAFATLPYVAYALAYAGDPLFLSSPGPDAFVDGRLTLAGWLYLAVKWPLWFFGGGALGAGVAWLIGIGFRVRPRRLG